MLINSNVKKEKKPSYKKHEKATTFTALTERIPNE